MRAVALLALLSPAAAFFAAPLRTSQCAVRGTVGTVRSSVEDADVEDDIEAKLKVLNEQYRERLSKIETQLSDDESSDETVAAEPAGLDAPFERCEDGAGPGLFCPACCWTRSPPPSSSSIPG